MSYARFSDDSDVYIYEHANGFIECCGCLITEPEPPEWAGFYKANTAREILHHIYAHLSLGHKVPERCIKRIEDEHPDLDAQIPPYVPDPAQRERVRARMRLAMSNKEEDNERD